MDENIKIGRIGEDIARKYLEKKGYAIIEQNCRTKYSEIDLICRKDDCLVFVEVRTRTGEEFGSPEESLKKKKINKLIRNANAYAAKKRWPGPCRIDAVCIVLDRNEAVRRIEHYNNITI